MLQLLVVLPFGVAAILGALNRKLGYAGMLVSAVIFGLVQFTPASYLSYFSLISSFVWVFVAIYSFSYGEHYGKWLSSMLPLTIMGMALILISTNYLVLITGWEIMSVPSYVIIALNKKEDRPAAVFMLFSEFSTVFLIAGVAYAYSISGTLNIIALNDYLPMLLISLAGLTKMGMTPFMISEWLPIAHGNAPANASAVLSSTMTLMGVFVIMRLVFLSPLVIYIGIFFLIIGGLSIIFAAIYAYISENMKMLAGFSTIENNASILSAIGLYIIAFSPTLRSFILIVIIIFSLAHSLSKTGLFLAIGNTGGEFFGEITGFSNRWNNVGTFLTTISLSGLFPTIGGLGVWMLLESFFMEAYSGGFTGIMAIIVGSVLALGEGMATGALLKVLSFGNLFHRSNRGRRSIGSFTVMALGGFLVFMLSISILVFPSSFISGIPGVLIFNGFMITSKFGSADFGVLSPDYIILLISVFSILAYAIFRKPRHRTVPVWNGGRDIADIYTSYAYSNNIRLMLRKILRTRIGNQNQSITVMDVFWYAMLRTGKAYKSVCKYITLRFMNSSIGWYMIYMIAAFMITLIISVELI